MNPALLNPSQAKAFYDSFGSRQNWQFYEDAAVNRMTDLGSFGDAGNILELGCGTGKVAARMFDRVLDQGCTYTGFDISDTMLELTKKALAPWAKSVTIRKGNLAESLPDPDATFDRAFSTYVIDLLGEAEIRGAYDEAHRVLRPEGLLCLTSMTDGKGLFSKALTGAFKALGSIRPSWTGGCRPVKLLDYLDLRVWSVEHHDVVTAFGVTSDVLIARKR